MPDRANHCPFLNRADARCAEHFNMQGLRHAFDHCFGQYSRCPVYFEMLMERRTRRAVAGAEAQEHPEDGRTSLVQVTVAAEQSRCAAAVPAVPRG